VGFTAGAAVGNAALAKSTGGSILRLDPMNRRADSAPPGAPAITVSVTFFADLRRFLPRGAEGPQRYTLAPGATVADLLARIGIEPGTDLTAAVNGELADPGTELGEGADVMLLSPMEGG
jgi:sulfur carrier protein ThiS